MKKNIVMKDGKKMVAYVMEFTHTNVKYYDYKIFFVWDLKLE